MEPKICRREVRAASGPVHHLTPSPTSHDSVTKRLLEEVQGSIWSMDSCPILTFDIIWKRVIMFKIAPAEKLPSATFLVQALPVFQEGLHPAAALADCDQWTMNITMLLTWCTQPSCTACSWLDMVQKPIHDHWWHERPSPSALPVSVHQSIPTL